MAKFLDPSRLVSPSRQGFTLVEVLVAAIIILLMVLATTGVIRTGQKVQALDQQGNRLRQFQITTLEDTLYSHARFDSLSPISSTGSLVLDDRGTVATSDDLMATTSLVLKDSTVLVDTVSVPIKIIRVGGYWNSLDGSDTLVMEKWICKVLL